MKPCKIFYTDEVVLYLRRLNPQTKPYLKSIVEELLDNPLTGKPLQREFIGYRVLRYKKYRVIYEYRTDKNTVEVVFAGLRRDVYQLFAEVARQRRK